MLGDRIPGKGSTTHHVIALRIFAHKRGTVAIGFAWFSSTIILSRELTATNVLNSS